MIRPLTCICFATAVGSGLYLYQAKDAATVLDRRIEKMVRDTEVTRDQTRALRTEWNLLNEPDRLRQLAEHYLPILRPVAPSQFTSLNDLDSRLPVPQVSSPSDQAPIPEDGSTNMVDGPADRAGPAAPDALPLPPVPPQSVAQAGPPPPSSPNAGSMPVPAPVPTVSAAAPSPPATPRAAEHRSVVAQPVVPPALVQPQGPRVPLPDPRPVGTRAVDGRSPEQRQADMRAVPAPTDLKAVEPVRTPDQSRSAEPSRTAEARPGAAPRPAAPVRSAQSGTAVATGPQATLGRPSGAASGSLLGMARDNAGAAAPAPVPIPRPIPVTTVPGQWPTGG